MVNRPRAVAVMVPLDAVEEFGGLLLAEGQEGAQAGDGEGAVAEEKEEEEQQDDKLREEADGVADQTGESVAEVGGGLLRGVVEIDGVGDGLGASRQARDGGRACR